MSQKTLRTVHLVYGIALSLLLLVTAVLFVTSAVGIYQSGSRPFSRESISAAFQSIAIPVYLSIAGIAGGALLSLFLPLHSGKTTAMRDDLDTLRRLERRLGRHAESREPVIRIAIRVGAAVISVALGIYPALLFLDPSRFTLENVNGSVVNAVIPALVWAATVIVLATISSLLCTHSVRREIALCKAAIAEGGATAKGGAESAPSRLRKHKPALLFTVRIVLAALAVVLIVLGVLNGGAADVLGKAIRICTECIGLG